MIRDKHHLDFIRQLECVKCASPHVEAAHLRMGTDGGMGMKPSDRWVLPLCSAHHRQQHAMGEPAFWSGWDPHKLCQDIWFATGDYYEAIATIERSRDDQRREVSDGTERSGEGEGGSFRGVSPVAG